MQKILPLAKNARTVWISLFIIYIGIVILGYVFRLDWWFIDQMLLPSI